MNFFINNINEEQTNIHIKNGDFVQIIRKDNSTYGNYYKGYICEIKNYRTKQTIAHLLLPNMQIIELPIDHFVKI